MGSGEHIAELLDKVIDNAVQFGVPQTVIEVGLVETEEGLLLTVANEGAVIDESQQERVFDPMVSLGRKDAKTSHLGLGLYVVRLIADYHQARTWMANRVDGMGVVMFNVKVFLVLKDTVELKVCFDVLVPLPVLPLLPSMVKDILEIADAVYFWTSISALSTVPEYLVVSNS